MGRASECAYRAIRPKRYPPPPKNTAKAQAFPDVGPGLEVIAFDKSQDWWKLDELPVGRTDFLFVRYLLSIMRSPANYIGLNARMTTFVQHKLQVHFTTLMPHLLHRLASYSPSHPSYPHPSLMNAIYLLSTFFLSSPSHPSRIQRQLKWNVKEAEYTLLRRVRMAMIEDSMDFNGQGEEVLDFILALGLVSRYFFHTGRYTIGQHEAHGTTKLRLSDFR
jgi:hypothetical protein